MGFPEPRMSGGMKLLSSDLQREWKLVISRVGYEWNMEIISYWFENHNIYIYIYIYTYIYIHIYIYIYIAFG